MCQLTELTPSLTVNKIFINVKDIDYCELCENFEPSNDIVTINSNFSHKALEGYEKYITKPKSEKIGVKKIILKKVIGDGSTFNSTIEFILLFNDSAKLLRYYPRSGQVQIIGCRYEQELVDKFIKYLQNSGNEIFSTVKIESGPQSLLQNFKFEILKGDNHYINIKNLASCLENEKELRNALPFDLQYIKLSKSDIHNKIAIVFINKIRVHIWMKSGKVNILGSTTELSASLIYNFIQDIFITRYDDFICDIPKKDEVK